MVHWWLRFLLTMSHQWVLLRLYMDYLVLHCLLGYRTGNYTPISSQLWHQYYSSPSEMSSLVCYLMWTTYQTSEALFQVSYLDLCFCPVLKSEKRSWEKEAAWTIECGLHTCSPSRLTHVMCT